ncbi:transcription factor [Nannizzia gypsea CBS 118893]|uniref:Transcription activator of gluconeogenesis MGYG_02011 n=1 Tax=Arthroderma gypseum (strain ATCC MYA-4604 / CBS 118893) TaxID=535722 RepID=ACUK_ARTGP|nr:transcription factor [Nannizzia gypsea CBS 118893]E4UP58.1 RecName: Full=Transcription activator of gluconeogenesis MGYG_02011 [Nannizzia gypsea CBS 118893]EFQ99000.1 transcription factor [Nannizzia gypsea CBS 118893]
MSPHQTTGQESDNMAVNGENAPASSQYIQTNNDEMADMVAAEKKAAAAKAAKDPSRPKRKKAKRACYACQRGHLTCGDERPCQRCIKRGFQDACHDGVRKKAKYLHDAPNEVLMAGVGATLYNQRNAAQNNVNGSNTSPGVPQQMTSPNFYSTQQSPDYNSFPQNKNELHDSTVGPENYASQSPVSPTYQIGQGMPNPVLSPSLPQSASETPSTANAAPGQFNSAFFDPSDPALFNFDLASMNFGNHYGALEFGMLGHMATGVGDTPPSDSGAQRGSIGQNGSGTFGLAGSNFAESPSNQTPYLFNESGMNDWTQTAPVNRRSIYGSNANMVAGNMSDKPHAFAIESAPANFASPASNESPMMTTNSATFEDTTNSGAFSSRPNASVSQQRQQPVVSTPQLKQQNLNLGGRRRHKNASSIYDSVKDPYSYTSGFHSLTAFIQRRFSPQKTLRIAKALASIRPSFIATTKTLNRDDLIFMEKCFQRTLWEYEDFINACGTPTIVCRRTGEIAAVGKEFSILTGWRKEVLLGKEPNHNVNTGGSSGLVTDSTSRGSYTPRPYSSDVYNSSTAATPRTQPVFLAELLDDDSVIEFYEDFAKLAFGDSRGSVMTTCKLLKYKTKADSDILAGSNGEADAGQNGEASSSEANELNGSNANGATTNGRGLRRWGKGEIAGEAGMNQLGFRDGKVECSYCWTVKRDVFDIPMLIVMNFLPCI